MWSTASLPDRCQTTANPSGRTQRQPVAAEQRRSESPNYSSQFAASWAKTRPPDLAVNKLTQGPGRGSTGQRGTSAFSLSAGHKECGFVPVGFNFPPETVKPHIA